MSFCPQSKRKLSKSKSVSKVLDESYSVNDLPSLRRKRTIIFNRIAKTLEIGSEVATALQLGSDVSNITKRNLFLSYYDDIKININKFEELHFIIIDFSERPEEDQALQEKCDEMYFEIKSIYRNLSTSISNSSLISGSKDGTSHVKLPKISLPTFSGDIKQWPEFFDKYNNLIHNCPTLSNTERFHYLVSTLRDDAASVIRTFPVTGEHYRDAYEFLVARYQNERELAFACWRDILNVNLKLINGLDLRRSLDSIVENLCVLKRLNLPVDQWDFILIYHVLSKLDSKLRREFEQQLNSNKLFKFDELHSFLQLRCDALLRDAHFTEPSKSTTALRDSAVKVNHYQSTPKRFSQNVNHTLLAAKSSAELATAKTVSLPPTPKIGYKCSFCGEAHSISQCTEFLHKTVPERMEVASSNRWCFNCLKTSHQLKDCLSIFSCQKCRRKHHTLLHGEDVRPAPPSSVLITGEKKLLSRLSTHTTVLLATALIQLKNSAGTFSIFRALFDTGSQNNLITEEAAKRLNIVPTETDTQINGLGGAAADVKGQVCCSVGVNEQFLFDLDFQVIHKICGEQPIAPLNTAGWTEIQDLTLADPGFDIPGPIDVVLGAEVFAECLLNERVKGTSSHPPAFKSIFGWLLLGKSPIVSHSLVTTQPIRDHELTNLVQRFWELDTLPTAVQLTPAERLCAQTIQEEHARDESGGFTVKLPFKDEVNPDFSGSREIAIRRFHAIERHLSRDPELHHPYSEFMLDYLNTGHMSLVPTEELGNGRYYIPHHCVTNPRSHTTNANHRSLNETLLTGSKLQANISDILLRFRESSIVFMVDIQQMYPQIMVDPCHRDYQNNLPLKVLGLKWDASSDNFLFDATPSNRPCTKRTILSEIAKIFDPLGFLSPLTIRAKCLIQQLWVAGVGWDETPPPHIVNSWENYQRQIHLIKTLRIPRRLTFDDATSYEIHGFCDSSEAAYGAIIYMKLVDKSKNIHISPICSKARIAPLKKVSLPHLELCAEVLLATLYEFVKVTVELPDFVPLTVHLWSDSTVTLAWPQSHSSRWATFVANRVSHVQDLTPTEWWHHVVSTENPADICSRGHLPPQLLHSSLWWAGPQWLSQHNGSLPNSSVALDEPPLAIAEVKRSVLLGESPDSQLAPSDIGKLFQKFSSADKIIRIIAYWSRFIGRARKLCDHPVGIFLTLNERLNALMCIVKYVQSEAFKDTLARVTTGHLLQKQFRKLNPFIDDSGIIRVGGRICHSGLEFDRKHPALLPSDSLFTTKLIDSIHRTYCHIGVNTAHFLLLQQFWIISAKLYSQTILNMTFELRCTGLLQEWCKCTLDLMGRSVWLPSKPIRII